MKVCLIHVFCFLSAVATARTASPLPAPADPLQTGFRFATAIEADLNDQAKAQEEIVSDLIALGRLEDAGRRADTIKGWRPS